MSEKVLTTLAVRSRSLEWTVLNKAGDKQATASGQRADFDPGENQKTLLAGLSSDHDRLVAEIREKCGRLPAPVSISIPASWVLLRIVELPMGNPEELKSMVELQVDKFSPFPVDESAVSYEFLAEHDGRCRLLLSAIRTETIDTLANSLRAAGIKPKWVDINVLGWWQLLKDAGKMHQTGSQVFIIIEDTACDIMVTTSGIPVALRSLNAMDDLPPEEVDEEISRELVYTFASLDLDRPGSHLTEINVWHRGESPAGLLKQLSEQFSVSAHPNSLETLPPLAEGLLHRAEKRTNGTMDLAPRAWMDAEMAKRTRRRIIVSSLVVATLWLGGMAALFGGIQVQKQRLSFLEKDLIALKEPSDKVRAIRDRTQELMKYMDRSRSGLECLREVSDRLPPGIELRSFNYAKNKSLEMTGESDAYALVADFKKDLERSDLFVATELPRTQHTSGGKEAFKIVCTLPGGEKK